MARIRMRIITAQRQRHPRGDDSRGKPVGTS